MIKFFITLSETEADILLKWALMEFRDPRDQIRFVVRQEMIRLGLLEDLGDKDKNTIVEDGKRE